VPEPLEDPALAQEPPGGVVRGRERRAREDLQRDEAVRVARVLRAVDDAHPPLAQLPERAVRADRTGERRRHPLRSPLLT